MLTNKRSSLLFILPAVFGIYISQTFITSLIGSGLPTLMRDHGMSLTAVGLSSLLFLPWGLCVFWAPFVERLRLPNDTHRKYSKQIILAGQWMIAIILLLIALALFTKQLEFTNHIKIIFGCLFIASIISASTDVACDGFMIDSLKTQSFGLGNIFQINGRFIGAMLGAGGFIVLTSNYGISSAFFAAAIMIVLLGMPLFLVYEKPRPKQQDTKHKPSLLFALRRKEIRLGALLIVLQGVGTALTFTLTGPFLVDKGMELEKIGVTLGTIGFATGIIGTIVAGILLRFIFSWYLVAAMLLLEGLIFINLGFLSSTTSISIYIMMFSLKHLILGCLWVSLYSALMTFTSPLQAGLDFMLMQSIMALVQTVIGSCGGYVAQQIGFDNTFILSAVLCLIGALIIWYQSSHNSIFKLTANSRSM